MTSTLLKLLHLARIAGFLAILLLPSVWFIHARTQSPPTQKTNFPVWTWSIDSLRLAPLRYGIFVERNFLFSDRCNLVSPPKPKFHFVAPNLSISLSSLHERPRRIYSTNSEGIRGPEFNRGKPYRILCVGDSVTQCSYLDDSAAWTYVVMTEMNRRLPANPAWVGGAGIPGYLAKHHLEYLNMDPSATRYTHLVFLIGTNDLLAWVGANVRGTSSGVPAPPSRGIPPPALMAGNRFGLFSGVPINSHLVDDFPSPQDFLRDYRSHVEAIVSMCNRLKVRPVFVTQPVLWAKDLPMAIEERIWTGRTAIAGQFLSTSSLRRLADMVNSVSLQVCREEGVPIADLSFMNGKPDFFVDDCHFTAEGAHVAGEYIAQTILADLQIYDGSSAPVGTR